MKLAAELISGDKSGAIRFLAAPSASRCIDINGTWENVLAKLLRGGDKPAFSIFAESGNVKLPFAAFSSLPVLDCPGMGECGKWCYSLTAWRYANAWGRQVSNSILLRSDAGRATIADAFKRIKAKTLRLYVDGDFHSKESLKWWMDLIKTRPDLRVYGYSKSWVEFIALHLGGYKWPDNYILNLSGGSRHGDPLRSIMETLPVTRGEFLAVPVAEHHIRSKAYQSKRNAGHAEYAKDVRAAAGRRAFVCPGKCGDCLPDGTHACGSDRFRGIPIVIGVH